MNIRDFSKTKQEKFNEEKTYDDYKQENPEKLKDLEENLDKYKNLSQQDLYSELLKEASKLRENGSLNEQNLNMLKNTLAPMLNNEQRQMLENIINNIK